MICLNGATDSSDSSIYSSMSLPSSPVRSSAIQQLLESPLIKFNSQNSDKSRTSDEPDTDLEVNDVDIIVPESPDTTPVGSQETDPQLCADLPLEVANSQPTEEQTIDTNCETNTQNNCRNSLRRQSTVSSMGAFNASVASSPRALAILKNAIKTGFNSNNKISDKTTNSNIEEVVKNSNDFVLNNGVNSPPNSKLFRNSPLTRGSALLKAAKERMEREENQRSPKVNYSQLISESSYDRQLTGILRKHELSSSPTSGEPKAKKKKVLFAEPVVSSKLEFKPSPQHPFSCFEPISDFLAQPLDMEVSQLTSKQNRVLVHQNSTFDNEFDSDSQNSSSPIVFFANGSEATPLELPSCGQPSNRVEIADDELIDSQGSDVQFPTSDSEEKLVPNDDPIGCEALSSQSSTEDMFMCSQVMPESSLNFYPETSPETVDSQTDPVDDPLIMVPMRLSQIKDLYQLFGGLIQQYSDS